MLHPNDLFVKCLNDWGRKGTPFVFLIDFLGKEPRAWRLNEADPAELRFDLNGITNEAPLVSSSEVPPYYFHKNPISLDQYRSRFEQVVKNIQRGNSFLVNLSAPTPIETNLSLSEIYQHSRAPYRFWLRDRFVCFSPEIFVRIQKNRIASFPMKGTISAEVPQAERIILVDAKEAAEHATIVDLIRNDLSRVADKVWVERYRYLDRIATNQGTLLQVSSEIAGLLPDDFAGAYGDLLLKLLPAGSISGAPKPATLKIIREAEGYERGYYTGVMGAFDGEVFESAVMIRYIEQQRDGLVFKSGGGITARSRTETEYQEMIDKVYLPFAHEPTYPVLRDDLRAAAPVQ
ncbi:aminodeoxychorismate synthase component I [Cytophagaceae bacterium SJW1-29]|uniref:Aminodeoxychorismate synthase component I n=1 Tax=Salmonirosea aquatica TaxID=2654236 RepID=A0A7C9BBL5_9BACT|nr:aminodeoxychorismate synthase component I [Cytophagaceae bacterium SJW1-29]